MPDLKVVPLEDVKVKFTKLMESLNELLEHEYGEEGYICAINLVWNVKTKDSPSDYTSLSAVSHQDDTELANPKQQIEALAEVLAAEPFVTGAVLHNLADEIVNYKYNSFKKTSTLDPMVKINEKEIN